MILLGLISRWTRPFLCTAAKPPATCVRNFQRQLYLEPARALDEILQGFSLHKLHCVEVTLSASPQMEDRGNIRVTDAGRRTRFAQETKPSRFVTEISFADDFQCHGAPQIDIERFVSDPHRTATQLDRFPVFVLDKLIVLKPLYGPASSVGSLKASS